MINKLTTKQYLVDIILISLDVGRQSKAASKVMCEIHYGDGVSYLKIKLQPVIKNGVAQFYEQRIRIPYSQQIALVFKMFKAKTETFLGHYTIEVEKYLQKNVYSAKLKQKLEEKDIWVDFQLKIIDKQFFCDEESDDLEDENLFPSTRSNYSEQKKAKTIYSQYKAKSDYNTPFVIIKKQQIVPILPEEFNKLLLSVEDILTKHRIKKDKPSQSSQSINGNEAQTAKSKEIQLLESHIKQAYNNQRINNYILWLCVALVSLFIGITVKS